MPKPAPKPSIVAKVEDGSPMVEIFSMEIGKDGSLVMDCKALGSMRMDVIISADDVAKGWPVVKASKKSIIAFAKQIPGALKKVKKAQKAAEAEKAAQA
ncbi:MAG: hypothetical protein Q4B69_02335 [Slackia sp.]|nr:hypothetical protein [Slackia sp.]